MQTVEGAVPRAADAACTSHQTSPRDAANQARAAQGIETVETFPAAVAALAEDGSPPRHRKAARFDPASDALLAGGTVLVEECAGHSTDLNH